MRRSQFNDIPDVSLLQALGQELSRRRQQLDSAEAAATARHAEGEAALRRAAEAVAAAEARAAERETFAEKRASEREAAAERRAADKEAAAERQASEKEAAAEKRAAERKATAERRAAEAVSAAEQRARAAVSEAQQQLEALEEQGRDVRDAEGRLARWAEQLDSQRQKVCTGKHVLAPERSVVRKHICAILPWFTTSLPLRDLPRLPCNRGRVHEQATYSSALIILWSP